MTCEELFDVIVERANASSNESWTAKLLSQGPEKCAEKFGEEAVEAIISAVRKDKDGLIMETADVLYHLFVMLKSQNIHLSDVLQELEKRRFKSGIMEKLQRG